MKIQILSSEKQLLYGSLFKAAPASGDSVDTLENLRAKNTLEIARAYFSTLPLRARARAAT